MCSDLGYDGKSFTIVQLLDQRGEAIDEIAQRRLLDSGKAKAVLGVFKRGRKAGQRTAR